MVQQQLYATMPKYVIRMAGETAKPGWIANVNPFVVVCFVSFITRLMAKRSAITSMNVGMFLIPFSALLMACGNLLGNDIISGMSNITLMMVAGIIVQALAECFISPRYLEYFSLQAPKGEEGMYLGFSHLHSFLSSIFGFGLAGILLTKYCPDPTLFETHAAWGSSQCKCALYMVLLCRYRIDCRHSIAIICKNHRIHRQKEEIFSINIFFFVYICRHFAVKVDGILHF